MEVDICGMYFEEIDDVGNLVLSESYMYVLWFNKELDFNLFDCWIWENYFCYFGVLMRKFVYDCVGLFCEELMYLFDWNFWLCVLMVGVIFYVIL